MVLVIIIFTPLWELTESNISRECYGPVRPIGCYKGMMEGKLSSGKNSLYFYDMNTENKHLICLCTCSHWNLVEEFQVSLTQDLVAMGGAGL